MTGTFVKASMIHNYIGLKLGSKFLVGELFGFGDYKSNHNLYGLIKKCGYELFAISLCR